MIMIWIFAIITFLITPSLAYADVPVFDGTTHTILRETKQLIDERTSILNQMMPGFLEKKSHQLNPERRRTRQFKKLFQPLSRAVSFPVILSTAWHPK